MIQELIDTTRVVMSLAQPDTLALEEQRLNAEKAYLQNNQVKTEQVAKSNIEFLETGNSDTRKARINLFYELPLNTKAYSFVEFYNSGYFSKTRTHTPIKGGFGIRTEFKSSNHFNDHIGLGVGQSIEVLGINAGAKAIPLWVDKNGVIDNYMSIGGYLSKQIDISEKVKLQLLAFGDMNVAGKEKVQWGYGEINAQLNYKNFDLGVGYNLLNKGSFEPEKQFRVKIGFHPNIMK